ncbi:hypothetical protein [Carnobacterium mobile]
MSLEMIKKLIWSSRNVYIKNKRNKFKVFDENGDLTNSASIIGLIILLMLIGIAGGIETGYVWGN